MDGGQMTKTRRPLVCGAFARGSHDGLDLAERPSRTPQGRVRLVGALSLIMPVCG